MTSDPVAEAGSATVGRLSYVFGVSSSAPRWRLGALLAILALGTAMRIHGLSTWSFAGDELNTLRDSVQGVGLLGPKPLLFILNHHMVVPGLGANEWSLRLLPAVFGILGIPAVYWAGARLFDWRVALAAAALVALNPWHLYWSQSARYYSLVFLLTALFPVALYLGVKRRSVVWIAGGLILTCLAFLAHPSSALVLGAFVVWLGGRVVGRLIRDRKKPGLREFVTVALVGVGIAIAAIRIWPLLVSWYQMDHEWGHDALILMLSYADWVALPITVIAAAGFLWMARGEERQKAVLLGTFVVLPALLLMLATYLVPVSTAYLFATTPFVLLLAGYLLKELWGSPAAGWRPRLIAVTLLAVVVVDHGPRIISHYRDGGRLDFRRAAAVLEELAEGDDVIVADQERAVSYYLPGRTVLRLGPGGTSIIEQLQAQLGQDFADKSASVWVLADWTRRGGFRDEGLGDATDWVHDRCLLVETIAKSRLDYKLNELRLYRCPVSLKAGEPGSADRIAGRHDRAR